MTSLHAKNFQSSLGNTALSTGYASNFQGFPRPSRRSHTAGKGYRNIDLQEHSFHFERASKDHEGREAVQSPFVNGRKNKEYINPTFHSSSFLTHNVVLRRAKTPEVGDFRNNNASVTASAAPSFRVVSSQTPREDVQVNRRLDFNAEVPRVEQREPERRAAGKSVSIVEPTEVVKIERPEEDCGGQERKMQSSKSLSSLEVCGGCYNWQLAQETADAKRRYKGSELEMERSVLDHNEKLLRSDKERERARKEMVVSTSRHNYDALNERSARNASRDADEVDIKMENKAVTAESIRSLKRYQSMLDKMYESSMRRHTEKKGDLNVSQSHNRTAITQKEQSKTEEKKKGSLVKWNLNDGEKSLLDTMHERSVRYTEAKDGERKVASDYNRQSGSARKEAADPFKNDAGEYERNGDGKSLLDKMYTSSLQYWQRQKAGLKDASTTNKERGQRNRNNEEDMLAREYPSPSYVKGKSVLDSLHHSDQKGLSRRKDYTVDCAGHNKDQGYSIESAQNKIRNLDNYYNSPTRKVNREDGADYEGWTENGGVFQMISSSAEKLHQGRKAQNNSLGGTIRQQMSESKLRRTEEEFKDKNFKHTPLLVCASHGKIGCCGVCKKQVPTNKMSKIVADYSKLAKGRGPRWNI